MAIKDCWKANKERKLHDGHVKAWMIYCRENKKQKNGASYRSRLKAKHKVAEKIYKTGNLPKWMYD